MLRFLLLPAILLLTGCLSGRPAETPAGPPLPPEPAAPLEAAESGRGSAGSVPETLTEPLAGLTPSRRADPGQPTESAAEQPAAARAETAAASVPHTSAAVAEPVPASAEALRQVGRLCEELGNKLGSVSVEDCLAQELQASSRFSVHDRVLAYRDFTLPAGIEAKSRILILGGIHGDEYSSISIMFKWMQLLAQNREEDFVWRFLPVVNPDGLLDSQAVRQNANGVDLNRNFPSRDWTRLALENWKRNTGSNARRYPGKAAASEPEVQWVVEQIRSFEPDVIVSVHAPYHLLDFDGPSRAPDKIGELYLHQLGVYPGSLGNYAGLDLGLPVVTLELPSAGIMPEKSQIAIMWKDLLEWLRERTGEGGS